MNFLFISERDAVARAALSELKRGSQQSAGARGGGGGAGLQLPVESAAAEKNSFTGSTSEKTTMIIHAKKSVSQHPKFTKDPKLCTGEDWR